MALLDLAAELAQALRDPGVDQRGIVVVADDDRELRRLCHALSRNADSQRSAAV